MLYQQHFALHLSHLNTSHVKVQSKLFDSRKRGRRNLNTSHVKVQTTFNTF